MNNAYETSGTSPTLFEPLLSDVEAGKLLGLHPKTLQRLARSGKIPSFKIQKYWKYRKSELEAWLQRKLEIRKEKKRATTHRRRTAEGSWTAQEWYNLKVQFGNRCIACGLTENELRVLGRTLSPDHVLPLSKGGLNVISNIQPLCHSARKGSKGGCNNIKSANHIDYRLNFDGRQV
jgi:excisionase family DNA binding protein